MRKLFPNEVVIRTTHFTVAQDWEVPIPAFFILSCNRAVRSIDEFDDEEAKEFALLLRDVRRGMREVNGCDEVYLFQNEDSQHGFHLWLFPRYDWMEQYGRKVQSLRPIMEYAEAMPVDDELVANVKRQVALLQVHLAGAYQHAA